MGIWNRRPTPPKAKKNKTKGFLNYYNPPNPPKKSDFGNPSWGLFCIHEIKTNQKFKVFVSLISASNHLLDINESLGKIQLECLEQVIAETYNAGIDIIVGEVILGFDLKFEVCQKIHRIYENKPAIVLVVFKH